MPADRLRQLGELDPADALVGREVLAGVAQDRERGLARRLEPAGEHDVGLRDREAQRVRRRDDGRLGDRLVLDQDRLSSSNGEMR